jgi:hypothetical protein
MTQKIDLRQLEKNTAGAIFQTGLVEIGIGLIFIVSTLAMLFDDIRYYIDILYVVPVIFIILTTKYIATPRMGVVKLARKRVRKTRLMMITITTFLIIMVSLTFFGGGNVDETIIDPRWIITGIIFFICVAVAYFMQFDRMYLYAFLLAGAFNLSEEIRENPGILPDGGYAYLLAAIIILAIGMYYLVRFLRTYPVPKEMVDYDG